jgi:hypothetical protein
MILGKKKGQGTGERADAEHDAVRPERAMKPYVSSYLTLSSVGHYTKKIEQCCRNRQGTINGEMKWIAGGAREVDDTLLTKDYECLSDGTNVGPVISVWSHLRFLDRGVGLCHASGGRL